MKKRSFHIASERDIRLGRTTDVYFDRTVEILKRSKSSSRVKAEFTAKSLPPDYAWAIMAGLEECLSLLEGLDIDLRAVDEGTVIRPDEPVMTIEGNYIDFGALETPLLGFLCQASGVATKAARLRIAAGEHTLISFGARRMHPAVSPMIERNAFVGGCDGVATVKAGEMLGIEPSGTMPHALVILSGGIDEALAGFDKYMPKDIKRIALVDTFGDEKFEALAACDTLGRGLYGVRLDTPRSRRGDMYEIVRELRWELDLRGYSHVRILVSGGLDEAEIEDLGEVVDGFGVGTCLSNARVIDYAMDIVEVDGESRAKRGKMSGEKKLLRCAGCHSDFVVPARSRARVRCECGGKVENLSRDFIKGGRITRRLPAPKDLRKRVLKSLSWIDGRM
ncbi:MAG: nicotinate phosphoribosyltransferase [Candidatus Eisenbacteria bacterium]